MKTLRDPRLQVRLNLLLEEIEDINDMVHPDSDEHRAFMEIHAILEPFYVGEKEYEPE